MSRITTYVLALVVIFGGCTKEIELEPFVYPQFLKNDLDFVEVFDDGGFLAYSNEGLFIKMDEVNEFVITPDESDYEVHMLNEMEFFKTPTKLFGVNNSWVMEFKNGNISFNTNDFTNTSGNVGSYSSYCLDNEGDLCVVYYGELAWDTSFYYNHELYIGTWTNSYWREEALDLWVPDTLLHVPSIAFGEDKFYISAGDIYEFDIEDYDFDKIVPDLPDEYVNMSHLHIFENVLYGQSTWHYVSDNTQTYSLNLSTGEFDYTEVGDVCPYNSGITYYGRILQYSEGKFHYFKSLESSFLNLEDGSYRTVKHNKQNCNEITLDFEDGGINFVYQIDYHEPSNSLYLATTSGLKVYSLDTKTYSDYLPELLAR